VYRTTLPPSCANYVDIWEPQPPGTLRACPGLYRDCFALYVPILKGQDVFLDILTFEGGTNMLSQNVINKLTPVLCSNPEGART